MVPSTVDLDGSAIESSGMPIETSGRLSVDGLPCLLHLRRLDLVWLFEEPWCTLVDYDVTAEGWFTVGEH